jgi:hypothetical protein
MQKKWDRSSLYRSSSGLNHKLHSRSLEDERCGTSQKIVDEDQSTGWVLAIARWKL